MDNETAAWQLEFVAKPDLPKWVICSYSTNSNSTSRDVGAFLRPKKRGPSHANWGDVEGEEEEQGEEEEEDYVFWEFTCRIYGLGKNIGLVESGETFSFL